MGLALSKAAERKSETVEAVPPSISVATSSSAAALVPDADPLNREKLWWEIQRTTCSKTDYDFYIKLIKSQLLLLQRTAQETIKYYKEMKPSKGIEKKSPEDIATYQQHLDTIFSDDHVSATALNVKSLQCAVLFALMLPHQSGGTGTFWDTDILPKFINNIDGVWDIYDDMFSYIKSDIGYNGAFISDLIIDESASCVPSFKDKAFIVLLGEMTLYELISSMANDVYLIGLPTKPANADGMSAGPLSFLFHDLLHMKQRQYNEIATKTNPLIQDFLKHLNTKEAKVRDTCHMFLFLMMHERPSNERRLLNVLNKEAHIDETDISRFMNKKDLGWFLPTDRDFTKEEVISWYKSEWLIFSKEWNEKFFSHKEKILAAAAASNWGSNMGGKNFSAATSRNAERYNSQRRPEPSGGNSSASSGGSRRRPGRGSRSKTRQQKRQQKRQRKQTRKHSLNLFKRNKE